MNVIMTTSLGRNGVKIGTARIFTDPRAAWEYALLLTKNPKTYHCAFYLLSSDHKATKMKANPTRRDNDPWDSFPDFMRELEQRK